MTLILTCLTPKYIVQVSDRRLTWPDGRLADDARNKVVVFGPHAAIAYTAISRIGKLPTDEWIAEELSGKTGIQEAITHLADSLTTRVRNLPYTDRRLAVAFDCWATTNVAKPNIPWCCTITNFHDISTGGEVIKPFNRFQVMRATLPPDKGYAFLPRGQQLPPETYKDMVRNLVRAMRHAAPHSSTVQPSTVGRFMMDAVRQIARANDRVGENLMLTVIFNHQLEEYRQVLNSFAYSRDNSSDLTCYAPALVTPTISIKGLKIYKGPPRFPI